MADLNPSASQIATELGGYMRTQNREIRAGIYKKSVTAGYMRTVTAVQGRFPALNSLTGHVVQGFQAVWTPLGLTEFTVNEGKSYRQKVNYPIVPSTILASWLAFLYEENKTPDQMSISQYLMQQELLPRVVDDRETLIGTAKYDATKKEQFGYSMDGIQEIIRQGCANGSMFQIPIEAPSLSNMVEQVEAFELGLPDVLKPLLQRIFMPQNLLEAYRLDYRNKYGLMPTFTAEGTMRTWLGNRELVPLPSLNGTQVIFATPADNFLRFIDINPTSVVTDVQVQDYTVKVFMEWEEGVGFWSNQLVVVAVPAGTHKGLGLGTDANADKALTEKYFGVQAAPLPA